MNPSTGSQMKDGFRKRKVSWLLLTLIAMSLVALAFAPGTGPTTNQVGQQAAPRGKVAFTNVNVIPMDSERVLEDHMVVVEDGLITAVGPAGEVSIPEGAEIIDGQGGYLMPGLADMHMHIMIDRNYDDPKQLLFFLSQGTTTIRALGTAPEAYPWREQIARGELVGPTMYTMGRTMMGNYKDQFGIGLYMNVLSVLRLVLPLLLGGLVYMVFKRLRSPRTALFGGGALMPVGLILLVTKIPPFMILAPVFDSPAQHLSENVAQAKAEVRRQQAWGVDGVKLYDGLSEEMYLAAMAEAKSRGMYVTGHLLDQLPIEVQLTSGINEIAHVDEFLTFHWIGYNPGNPDPTAAGNIDFPIDYESIPQTAALVAKNDVAVVSNMSTDEALYQLILDTEGTFANPEYAAFRPDLVEAWRTEGRHLTIFANQGEYRRDVAQPFLSTLIKSLHDEGALILVGTDVGAEGSLPSHIHREVELLVEAGFSNYEALEAGTKNAGIVVERMGRYGNFGTVEVGQRADLILLSENPLENVSATRNRYGVMTNGRWYTQSELDGMLEEYLASFAQ